MASSSRLSLTALIRLTEVSSPGNHRLIALAACHYKPIHMSLKKTLVSGGCERAQLWEENEGNGAQAMEMGKAR